MCARTRARRCSGGGRASGRTSSYVLMSSSAILFCWSAGAPLYLSSSASKVCEISVSSTSSCLYSRCLRSKVLGLRLRLGLGLRLRLGLGLGLGLALTFNPNPNPNPNPNLFCSRYAFSLEMTISPAAEASPSPRLLWAPLPSALPGAGSMPRLASRARSVLRCSAV